LQRVEVSAKTKEKNPKTILDENKEEQLWFNDSTRIEERDRKN